jgi:hypothetical protein
VLAVVQYEKQVLLFQCLSDLLEQRSVSSFEDPGRDCYRLGDKLWIGQRRHLDEPDPIGKAVLNRARQLDGEASLPDSTGPDKRQKSCVDQEVTQLGEFLIAPDQTRDSERQPPGNCYGGGLRSG